MKLKPKRRRLLFVITGVAVLGAATALVLFALTDRVDLFLVPTGVYERNIAPDVQFRLGGLVQEGSIKKSHDGLVTSFIITDNNKTILVQYKGILPSLFREGQGVVTEGKLSPDRTFIASSVLAKHDEDYLPPEIAKAIKKQGQWKGRKD